MAKYDFKRGKSPDGHWNINNPLRVEDDPDNPGETRPIQLVRELNDAFSGCKFSFCGNGEHACLRVFDSTTGAEVDMDPAGERKMWGIVEDHMQNN